MLKINNLKVVVDNKKILEDFNLEINSGEIHVLMGPNGAGKSTISKVILGNPTYQVVNGSCMFNDFDLLNLTTTEIAKLGIFLISQNPTEIKGVTNAEMLRTSLNDLGNNLNILEFHKEMKELCHKLNISESFIHHDINYNMSGGEKKKNELLQMGILKPKFIILDEIDSGLDVDSLKQVANFILDYYKEYKPAILIITHQKSLLDILKPQFVHILANKKIVKSGDYNLALEIFENGFNGAHIISDGDTFE